MRSCARGSKRCILEEYKNRAVCFGFRFSEFSSLSLSLGILSLQWTVRALIFHFCFTLFGSFPEKIHEIENERSFKKKYFSSFNLTYSFRSSFYFLGLSKNDKLISTHRFWFNYARVRSLFFMLFEKWKLYDENSLFSVIFKHNILFAIANTSFNWSNKIIKRISWSITLLTMYFCF